MPDLYCGMKPDAKKDCFLDGGLQTLVPVAPVDGVAILVQQSDTFLSCHDLSSLWAVLPSEPPVTRLEVPTDLGRYAVTS